jgi:6-phosphogluconolactonase
MKQVIAFLASIWMVIEAHAQTPVTCVFVGTYTEGQPGNGIYVYELKALTGDLVLKGTGEQLTNPSFLTLSHNGRYLYACTDTKTALPGSISAFAVDSTTCSIHFINKQSSTGANPVYLAADATDRFIVAGNYTGGSIAVLPVGPGGQLNRAVASLVFSDSSINRERQEQSHIHSTVFSPDGKFVFAPDLGADKIRVFRLDGGAARPLQPADSLLVRTLPGTGPRHITFHPFKPLAYCIEEMGGYINAYAYRSGRLQLLQRIPSNKTTAAGYSSADIHVSPDGHFLYASNRYENTISIFSINRAGRLRLIAHQSTQGEVPRNFAIDPTGIFLLVANQASNNIVVFRRNKKTGLLSAAGKPVQVPAPSCMQVRSYTR